MQNHFLVHQQFVIDLVVRIRLLLIFKGFVYIYFLYSATQEKKRPTFSWRDAETSVVFIHPGYPRPVESWLETHLHQCHFPETLFSRHLNEAESRFRGCIPAVDSLSEIAFFCHCTSSIFLFTRRFLRCALGSQNLMRLAFLFSSNSWIFFSLAPARIQ